MNPETIQLVNQLASKLGTTTEHLWAVLVRQAPIDSIIDLCLYVVFGVIFYACFKSMKKYVSSAHGYNTATPIAIAGVAILGVIFLVLFISSIQECVDGFFNPEYSAIHQIIDSLKSSK